MSPDEQIIDQAARAHTRGGAISDGQARVVAGAFHAGKGSALYALASSGAIEATAESEIENCLHVVYPHECVALAGLFAYVAANGERGPMRGWRGLR